MPEIKGIAKKLVTDLLNRSSKLGQGRNVGTIGFVDQKGYISERSAIIDGGSSGLPFRQVFANICESGKLSLLEMINHLPANAVIISTKPGKTGLIVNTGGVNVLNLPVVKIGVKNKKLAGVGLLYPSREIFRLASAVEKIQLKTLAAMDMEEEKEALRKSTELHLKHLDISEEIPVVSVKETISNLSEKKQQDWRIPEVSAVKSIDQQFARKLIDKSLSVEQGREVAAFGRPDHQGHLRQAGEIIVGGMGYIPSRLLASSYTEIKDVSLREAYTELIPFDCVIVHTHPGGTGVMHISDAMAGPGTWGRAIVAIGHNERAEIKGANVIMSSTKIFKLADEKEKLDQQFFKLDTSQEEVKLRKRRYQIAQEFTDLCEEIDIC